MPLEMKSKFRVKRYINYEHLRHCKMLETHQDPEHSASKQDTNNMILTDNCFTKSFTIIIFRIIFEII